LPPCAAGRGLRASRVEAGTPTLQTSVHVGAFATESNVMAKVLTAKGLGMAVAMAVFLNLSQSLSMTRLRLQQRMTRRRPLVGEERRLLHTLVRRLSAVTAMTKFVPKGVVLLKRTATQSIPKDSTGALSLLAMRKIVPATSRLPRLQMLRLLIDGVLVTVRASRAIAMGTGSTRLRIRSAPTVVLMTVLTTTMTMKMWALKRG